jgi:peroxiredoxin
VSEASLWKRRPALVVATAVGLLLIAFVAVLATRTITPPGAVASSPLQGKPAPSIAGVNVMNGSRVSLADERGHYVVVAFFASWCPQCVTETPQLVAFLYAERAIHASVIGVIYDDSVGNAQNFLRYYGAHWPAVADTKGVIAAEYGVVSPPEAFVVAPSGRIIDWIPGGVTEAELLQIVELGQAA